MSDKETKELIEKEVAEQILTYKSDLNSLHYEVSQYVQEYENKKNDFSQGKAAAYRFIAKKINDLQKWYGWKS